MIVIENLININIRNQYQQTNHYNIENRLKKRLVFAESIRHLFHAQNSRRINNREKQENVAEIEKFR